MLKLSNVKMKPKLTGLLLIERIILSAITRGDEDVR